MFLNKHHHFLMFKCECLLEPVLGDVGGNLQIPLHFQTGSKGGKESPIPYF
jgi:hypothetical protein